MRAATAGGADAPGRLAGLAIGAAAAAAAAGAGYWVCMSAYSQALGAFPYRGGRRRAR